MRQDESFGVIPLSKESGKWEVFLIQHKGGRYWGFPKGHSEGTETPKEAALRELKEETNLDVMAWLQPKPLMEQYQFLVEGKRVFKRVFYFVAEVSGEVKLQEAEIQDGIWLGLTEALEKVTHTEGKTILSQVTQTLLDSTL